MGQTMNIMGWISLLVCFAIMGMGGAPIAEKFEIHWLMNILLWISYVSVGLLTLATSVVGGIGIYHGFLTIMGKRPGGVTPPMDALSIPSPRPLRITQVQEKK